MVLELEKERVHIIPVGFEKDRVIMPLHKYKGDRVWLVTQKDTADEKDLAISFVKELKTKIEKMGIECNVKTCNIFNLTNVLKSFREIYDKEKNNLIFVNISCGNKITSIAGSVACMLWGGNAYYVSPEKYEYNINNQISSGMKNVIEIPKLSIEKPNEDLIEALLLLNTETEKKRDGTVKKSEFLKILKLNRMILAKGNSINADYNYMNRHFIDPLMRLEYIKQSGIQRKRINITENGKNALNMFSVKYSRSMGVH